MSLLNKFKQENPAYAQVPDSELAPALYRKFYADKMSEQEFAQKITASELPAQQQYDFTPAGAAIVGAAQGLSGGLSDELAAATGGVISRLGGGSYSDEYNRIMQQQQEALAAAREQQKYAMLGGEIAGFSTTGLAGGAKFAGTKALEGMGRLGIGALGALQGGAYEYATGYGGAGERFKGVPTAAGLGFGLGVGGSYLGSGIIAGGQKLGSLYQKAKSVFRKKPVQSVSDTAMEQVGLTGAPLSQTQPVGVLAEKGSAIVMTKGAATGDVNLMRLEEAARQGNLGDDLQKQIQGLDQKTIEQVKGTVQALRGQSAEEADTMLSKGIDVVKNMFTRRRTEMNKLMTARNEAIAGASVYKDYTKNTLEKSIDELTKTPDFQVALPKDVNAAIRDELKTFKNIVNKKGDINFTFLQSWRAGLNDLRKGGDQKAVLAKKLSDVYDEWLDGITKDALKAGDSDIAEKIFNANRRYTKYKNLYGTNKQAGQNSVIQDILNKEDLTPKQAVNAVFGKNIAGNNYTAQNVKRLLEGAETPEKQKIVADNFRGGLIMRAYENATKKGDLSLSQLKNDLISIRRSETYKMNLAEPEFDSVLQNLISDLGKIVSAQTRRDVYSPSGPAVIRGISYVFDKLGYVLPSSRAVASGLEAAASAAGRQPDKKAVQKALQEVLNEAQTVLNSKPMIYGGAAASSLGAPAATENRLFVKVTPNDKNMGEQ